ncbi:MAG: hypothetical protein PHS15_00950, partial [Clostridiaceae bacterium]|nr:hypothetical protein [Clostridiaceae bacterium]
MDLRKYLIIDSLYLHIEKYINNFINSDPVDEQEKKIISLLRDYKEKSTSGLPEAREIIKSHIKNSILTGFDIYLENENGGLDDASIFEEIRIDETNGLIDSIMPFNDPKNLTARERFEIILYKNRSTEKNERDGAFKVILSRYPCCDKTREAEGYESLRYEYNEEDIENIYNSEDYELSFTDRIEIVTQRLYEEIFG